MTTTAIIVQDFARNDLEMRHFVINGQIVHRVYSNFVWVDTDGYFREFVVKDREAAVAAWMAADGAAMAHAEAQASKLVKAWLAWFKTQSVEALPGVRIDVLVIECSGRKMCVGFMESKGYQCISSDVWADLVCVRKACLDD